MKIYGHKVGACTASGVSLIALASAVLLGWAIESTYLVQGLPRLVPMQVNTALGLLSCGAALLLHASARPGAAAGAAALSLVLAGVTLVEYALDRDLGSGRWLLRPFTSTLTVNPGQMSLNTSTALLISAFGLIAPRITPNRPWLPAVAGAIVLALGTVSLFGYLARIEWSYAWTSHSQMAVHTAAGFVLVGLGLLRVSNPSRAFGGNFAATLAAVTGLAVCLTITISIWQGLRAGERASAHRAVALRAESAARILAQQVAQHRSALLRLAQRWYAPHLQSRGGRNADAARYLRDFRALLGLNLLQRAGSREWRSAMTWPDATAPARRLSAADVAALLVAEESGGPAFTTIAELAPGLPGIRIYVPSPPGSTFNGAIEATLSLRELLAPVLTQPEHEGFSVAVLDGGREAWRSAAQHSPDEREWSHASPVLLHGLDWRLRVWPSTALLARLQTPLPEIVLAFGLALSLALALLAVLASRMWLAASTLRDLNFKLRSEARERSRAQQELRRTNASLTTANKELESFAYAVSHDLRQPLRALVGFSRILNEDCGPKLDAAERTHLERIRSAAERMGTMIDGLLTLSRVTRAAIQRDQVDLSALARATAQSLRDADPAREVDWMIAPDLAGFGDSQLVAVLVENLLGNAWKFTAHTPHARIELGQVNANGTHSFFVRDNGAGFDMQYAEKLFKVFQRLHAADEYPGTGIGLATVDRIVRRHGGQIWAESKENEGTTFYFTLTGEEPGHDRFVLHPAGGGQPG